MAKTSIGRRAAWAKQARSMAVKRGAQTLKNHLAESPMKTPVFRAFSPKMQTEVSSGVQGFSHDGKCL